MYMLTSLCVSVVGQLLTYHFASMLGLDNVPMTLLRHSDRRSRQRGAARLDDRGPYLMVRQLSPTSSVSVVTQYIPEKSWCETSELRDACLRRNVAAHIETQALIMYAYTGICPKSHQQSTPTYFTHRSTSVHIDHCITM